MIDYLIDFNQYKSQKLTFHIRFTDDAVEDGDRFLVFTTTWSKFWALHLNLSRSSNFGFDWKSIVMSSVTFTTNSYFKLFLRELIFLPYVLFRCCSISIGPLSKLYNLKYDKNLFSRVAS